MPQISRKSAIHSIPNKSTWPLTLAALLLLCSLSAQAQLVIFNVNSNLDEVDSNLSDGLCQTAAGTCTLRAAVMQSNLAAGIGAEIVLPAGAYVLTRASGPGADDSFGDLDFTANTPSITIRGAGAALSIIDANRIDRVLTINQGRPAEIFDLTIRGGLALDGSGNGGGILSRGNTTLTRVLITDNDTTSDGLSLTGYGGGIYASPDGSLRLFDSRVTNNRAADGAGLFNFSQLTVNRSTISGNMARGSGGGLLSFQQSIIRNSLISGNTANIFGGGIFYRDAAQALLHSTISGNFANRDGGGIYVLSGGVSANNISVIGNDADHDRVLPGGRGGGIFVAPTVNFFAANNVLVAKNTILNEPTTHDDCNGVLRNFTVSMLGTVAGCSSSQQPLSLVTRTSIGPLQNNDGPTLTHALLAGSEAIDGSFPNVPCDDLNGPALFDQRGAPRVFGVRCDVGAYEFGSVVDDLLFKNGFQ